MAKLYGNLATKIVHANKQGDQCRAAEIKKENLVHFDSLTDAIDQGYTACKTCFPQE